MASEEKHTTAEQLKAEGNALHLKGDHAAARSKYSEAIALDPENAILYANRAASYLALKQWVSPSPPSAVGLMHAQISGRGEGCEEGESSDASDQY